MSIDLTFRAGEATVMAAEGQATDAMPEILIGRVDGPVGHAFANMMAQSKGHTAMWFLNVNVRVGHAFGPTVWAGWRVVGVADFNLDGHPDYLLFNQSTRQTAIWYLNNNVHIASAAGPTLPTGWSVVAP